MRIYFKLAITLLFTAFFFPALKVAAATKSVTVKNYSYSPASVAALVGDTVTWTWSTGSHTVTSDDFFFDSGASGSPHTFSYRFNAAGSFPYYCQFHGDTFGMTGSVTVQQPGNVPPVVTITSPAANAILLYSPTNIVVQATATDSDGTVVSVDFYLDNGPNFTSLAPPFTMTFPNVGPGAHTIKVVATDDIDAQTTAIVNITVNNPPTAAITVPSNNSVAVTTSNVTLTATGSDADGTLSQLQIYVNNVLFGSSTTSPFSKTFVPATNGVYSIKAVSTDNRGAIITSTPVQLTSTVINLSSFKVLNNKFQFNISGLVAPKNFVLQGASSLADSVTWTSLQTNAASSDTFTFSDSDSTGLNLRYYRVIELP